MKIIQSKAAKLGLSAVGAIMAVFIVVASVGAPAVHAQQLNANAQALAGLIAVNNLAVTSGVPVNNLGSLIVLSGLFPTSTSPTQNAKNLAGLIAVDAVTSVPGGSSAYGAPTNLADLIVLNGLFLDP